MIPIRRSRVVAPPPQETSTPTATALSVDSGSATSSNPAGIAASVESMGASAAHGWWGSPGAGRGSGSSLPGASDFGWTTRRAVRLKLRSKMEVYANGEASVFPLF